MRLGWAGSDLILKEIMGVGARHTVVKEDTVIARWTGAGDWSAWGWIAVVEMMTTGEGMLRITWRTDSATVVEIGAALK